MQFNILMPKALKPFYQEELRQYKSTFLTGQLKESWHYLERAHILGQRYPREHTYVHWKMLQFGFRIKNTREIVGQIPRLLFGGIKSFVGHVPVGNPGGANVPPLRSVPISSALQAIFQKAGLSSS